MQLNWTYCLILAGLLVWYFIFVCLCVCSFVCLFVGLIDDLLIKVSFTLYCSVSIYFEFSTHCHGKYDF